MASVAPTYPVSNWAPFFSILLPTGPREGSAPVPVTRTRQAGHFTQREPKSAATEGWEFEKPWCSEGRAPHVVPPPTGESGGGLDWVPPGVT